MQSIDIKQTPIVPRHFKYAHVKRDGIQIEMFRSSQSNTWKAYTRTPSDITDTIKQVPTAQNVFLLPTSCPIRKLKGELYYPGHEAKDVKTLIANCQFDKLRFEAHWIEFADLTLPIDLTAMCYHSSYNEIPFTHWLDLERGHNSETFQYIFSEAELREGIHCSKLLELRDTDSDGWVLKDHAYYSTGWLKLKPRLTCDRTIIGFTEGKGKYRGMIGAIILVGDVRCSGMDDTTRRMFSDNPSKFIGMKVEVAYEKVIKGTGGLRHPRFIRLRDDL